MASNRKMDMREFADHAFKAFMRENRDNVVADTTLVSAFQGFVHAVNWREPWIVSLLAVHAAIALLALLTRRKPNVQAAMFLVVCGAVYSAQYLNGALARRWRELGFTQDYFDDRGVFISFVYSLPLLVMCGAMMLNAFFTSIELLVKVKRAELRRGAAGARPAAPSPLTDGGGGAAAAGTATAPSPAVKRTTRSSAAASGKKA